eukprot:scaffold221112_cov16-Prasinocladus_malaysianus.AAC.1
MAGNVRLSFPLWLYDLVISRCHDQREMVVTPFHHHFTISPPAFLGNYDLLRYKRISRVAQNSV